MYNLAYHAVKIPSEQFPTWQEAVGAAINRFLSVRRQVNVVVAGIEDDGTIAKFEIRSGKRLLASIMELEVIA